MKREQNKFKRFKDFDRNQQRIIGWELGAEGFGRYSSNFIDEHEFAMIDIPAKDLDLNAIERRDWDERDLEKLNLVEKDISKHGYNRDKPIFVLNKNKVRGGFHRAQAVRDLQDSGKLPDDFKIPSIVAKKIRKEKL